MGPMTPPTATVSVECEVAAQTDLVPFVHNLGCHVTITGYDTEGNQVGYVAAVPIDENEVEIVVVPGTIARLVAAPAPADDTTDEHTP